jgi:hypothetical protein
MISSVSSEQYIFFNHYNTNFSNRKKSVHHSFNISNYLFLKKTENTTRGMRCADYATPSIRKRWHYFAKKQRSLGRHSSLADQSHEVFFF